MDTWQMLWGFNTLILGILSLLYKTMREDIKELRKEQQDCVMCKDCERKHDDMVKMLDQRHTEFDKSCDRIHANIMMACNKNHEYLGRHAHVHGSLGQAGEVIQK